MRRQLPGTAHSQRKRTYQMVSFFSCGPNRGLAWARMAMSQLQRNTACRQPPWQDQSAGSGCCPGDDGPGREAGRSPGAVLSIHGGSWAAATGPGEASGGTGGKVPGPARGTHKR